MDTIDKNLLTDCPEDNSEQLTNEPSVTETEQMKSATLSDEIGQSAADVVTYLKRIVLEENPDRDKIESIKSAFYKRQKQEIELAKHIFAEEGHEVADFDITPYNALETELKSSLNLWREKRAEQVALMEKARQDNLEKKNQIIAAIHALNEDTDDIRKSLKEVQALQQQWKGIGNVAQEHINDLWRRYQAEVERFYDQLRLYNEFRDYDSKKNLEAQTALCVEAEQLLEESDVVVAFRKLQTLHEHWRETGPVAKEIREEIWQRFKAASTAINKKHQQFFERLKELETENLKQKEAICQTIEAIDLSALNTHKDWEKSSNVVFECQERWKTIGFASKKANGKIFERYRQACDRFFEARTNYYKESKESLLKNLELKKALCEKAEALKDSTDWNATSAQLVQIQKEWKAIGTVPRRHSDALWKRFKAACDYFFEQKNQHTGARRNEEMKHLAEKQALIQEVSECSALPDSSDKAIALIKGFIERWEAIGHVPYKEKDTINNAWRTAINQLSTRLNVDRTSRRLSSFQSSLADMNSKGEDRIMQERKRLMRQYDALTNDIKTCENNIGFFTMSSKSSGASLLKEMRRNIEKLKEERELILKKIQLIDNR